MLQDGGRTVLEAAALDEPHRSWFVDADVYEDGRLVVFAPVHPVFLVLPALERARQGRGSRAGEAHDGVFMQLDEILHGGGLSALAHTELLSDVAHVCDVKHVHGLELYRLNETKATAWLAGSWSARIVPGARAMMPVLTPARQRAAIAHARAPDRVARVAAALKGRPSLDAAQAADVDSTAMQVVLEYVDDAWAVRLQAARRASAGTTSVSAAQEDAGSPDGGARRSPRKVGAVAPLEDYSRPSSAAKVDPKKARPTPAQKALSSVDTSSMKKMSAFFIKKA